MLTFLRHQTGAAVLLSGFLATTLPLDSRAAVSSVAAGDAQAGTSDLPGVLNFPLTRALDLGYDVAVRYHTVAAPSAASTTSGRPALPSCLRTIPL